MKTDATFSPCRTYRYALYRIWDETKRPCLFIGLNPSTADETNDDPTIRRCIAFAKAWGYGGLIMANIFAYRATDPKEMKAQKDPVGPDNDSFLKMLNNISGITVAAWGAHGDHFGRADKVLDLLDNVHYLKLTKYGHPQHPLYLPKTLVPILMMPPKP